MLGTSPHPGIVVKPDVRPPFAGDALGMDDVREPRRREAPEQPPAAPSGLYFAAKVLGIIPAAIGWIFIVGDAVSEPENPGAEGYLVLAGLFLLTVAALTTWRAVRLGAWAEILAGATFGAIVYGTAGSNRLAVAVLLPLPWLMSGLALLILDKFEPDDRRDGSPTPAKGA